MDYQPFCRCTFCDWLGTLDETVQDGSIAEQDELCPECFSHTEPND